MKGIGCVLVLLAGILLQRQLLKEYGERIRMGEELTEAIDFLRRGIFTMHTPLLSLLTACCGAGEVSAPFFDTLVRGLQQEQAFSEVWREALLLLPGCYRAIWLPLGQALPLGQQEELFTLTREETHRIVSELRGEKRNTDKLVSALCLSVSLLVIVVLV